MKLEDAQFCVECEEIVDSTVKVCPSCTGTVFFVIGRVIRPERKTFRPRPLMVGETNELA